MSIDEIESGKTDRLDLDDLPDSMPNVSVGSTTWEEDRYGRNCLIVEYRQDADESVFIFTQKYTPMHLSLLGQIMKVLEIKNIKDWVGTLVKVPMKIGFDRMFPDQPEIIKAYITKQKKK